MTSPSSRLRQSCNEQKLVWGNRVAVVVAFSQTLFLCSHGYVVPPTPLSVSPSPHTPSASASTATSVTTAFLAKKTVALSVSTSASPDFDAFADSLEIDDSQAQSASAATSTKERPSSSTSSSPSSKTTKSLRNEAGSNKPWQAKLEELLDPTTNIADRQILLSELLNSNDEIRDSVLDALSNRKVRTARRSEEGSIFFWWWGCGSFEIADFVQHCFSRVVRFSINLIACVFFFLPSFIPSLILTNNNKKSFSWIRC